MDIKHRLGADMVITLDRADLEFMDVQGYVMDRNGVCGCDTKTWVRNDMPTDEPNAQIDGASDVTVYIPKDIRFPIEVPNGDIDPYMDPDRGRVQHFFGEAGKIIVKAS